MRQSHHPKHSPGNPRPVTRTAGAALLATAAASLGMGAVGLAPASATSRNVARAHSVAKVPITLWTLTSNTNEQKAETAAINDFNTSYPGGDVQVD